MSFFINILKNYEIIFSIPNYKGHDSQISFFQKYESCFADFMTIN